jgi:hypothetical protein
VPANIKQRSCQQTKTGKKRTKKQKPQSSKKNQLHDNQLVSYKKKKSTKQGNHSAGSVFCTPAPQRKRQNEQFNSALRRWLPSGGATRLQTMAAIHGTIEHLKELDYAARQMPALTPPQPEPRLWNGKEPQAHPLFKQRPLAFT